MKTVKNICFVAILAVIIFFLQNIDGRRCRKNYTCPNTTMNINNAIPIERRNAFRQFVRDTLTSTFMPPLTATGRRFVNCILSHVNTDSPSLLNSLAAFTLYAFSYLLHADSSPSLCMLALNINGSRRWAENRDGNFTANALLSTAQISSTLCEMTEFSSLTELNCDNVTVPPPLPNNCYRRGYVYDIVPSLKLFGQNLPCCLYDGVLDLYELTTYPERVMAAAFMIAITPEAQGLFAFYDVNLLEPTYMVINNNVSSCCCSKRQARFNVLCATINAVVNVTVNTAINDTYLFDECATEVY